MDSVGFSKEMVIHPPLLLDLCRPNRSIFSRGEKSLHSSRLDAHSIPRTLLGLTERILTRSRLSRRNGIRMYRREKAVITKRQI
jgi:hypothetical protein